MPRLRSLLILVAIIVFTDVTWDGAKLTIAFGVPRRKSIVSFEFP